MREQLEALRDDAIEKIEQAQEKKVVQEIRVKYLGKKGPVTEVLRGMGKLSPEERPVIGQLANDVREAIGKAIESKMEALEQAEIHRKLQEETIDVTLPGRPILKGGPIR